MQIHKQTASETQNDYVGRCMSEISNEYDTNEQAVAICINTYQRGTMSKTTQDRVADKIKGVSLLQGLEKGPNDPCYEDYVQIGTKIVDGREVPNCVPIK